MISNIADVQRMESLRGATTCLLSSIGCFDGTAVPNRDRNGSAAAFFTVPTLSLAPESRSG